MIERTRILVVDDSPVIRTMMARVFEAVGCEVNTAEDGRAGWRALLAFHPDVILTDYNMPDVDGLAFVQKVRRDPFTRATPIFVVSSEDCPLKRAAMDRAGANGWFPKPAHPPTLIGAVMAAATVGQMRAEIDRAA